MKNDLFLLKSQYGQARGFPSLEHRSLSARCRMVLFENSSRGGLRIHDKVRTLDRAVADSDQALNRQFVWASWFSQGIIRSMHGGLIEAGDRGISIEQLKEKAAGPSEEEEQQGRRYKRMKKMFQKTCSKELDARLQSNPSARMRFKLERWELAGLPGITADRFPRALDDVRRYLPPRVGAAVLKTAWNGWCTRRRFQLHGRCVFRCGSWVQEDSIEHYAGCPVCVGFLRNRLRYRGATDRGHLVVLGTHIQENGPGKLMRLALWSYTLFRAFNMLRCYELCVVPLSSFDSISGSL